MIADLRSLTVLTTVAAASVTVAAIPAAAQVTSVGVSPAVSATNGVLSVVAYDDKHDVYLHVYEHARQVIGQFIARDGTVLGSPFEIGTYKQSFAGQPKVAYSHNDAAADTFLVTYTSDANVFDKSANIFGQRVVYTGASPYGGMLLGSHILVSPNSGLGNTPQFPNDLAYNPLTHQFVASYYENYDDVWVRAFAADGTPAGGAVNVSAGPGSQGELRVAVDWQQNRIGVAFMGDNPIDGVTPGIFARVLDGTTLQATTGVLALTTGYTLEPAIVFLPERGGFLSTWTALAPDRNVMGRFVSTAGAVPEGVMAVAVTGSNEGAAVLRYDFVSRRVLVAAMSEPKNISGVLLDGLGTPLTTPFNLTTVVPAFGSFNPSIARGRDAQVGVSFITDYNASFLERFQLTPASQPGPECCSGGGVSQPPTITAQPQSQTVSQGTAVTLTVVASGTAPLSYQWYLGTSPDTSSPISGANSSSYTTSLFSTASFWVRVSNAQGSADSATAVVTVTSTGPGSFVTNGSFDGGTSGWQFYATPDLNYMYVNVVGGILEFYRVAPPPGTSNQATAFQHTGQSVAAGAPVRAQFDLGNTSGARKRISVLLLEADFSDLSVCTFWLEPHAPMRRYSMLAHTTKAWTNAAIYFYAASVVTDGGAYLLDNVVFDSPTGQSTTRIDCVDPTAPSPPGGADSANLVQNPGFDGGLQPWTVFGNIGAQVTGGVLEFYQPAGMTAGTVMQSLSTVLLDNQIVTASFTAGNSTGVRKRLTVLLHDLNFSDLAVCSFWLPPGLPLSQFTMKTYASKQWNNATVSFYDATSGLHPWTHVDNVAFKLTPGAQVAGTECLEPGSAFSLLPSNDGIVETTIRK